MPFLVNPYVFGVATPDVTLGPNLLVWYKKNTGIYDAISGGSLVSVNGTQIGRWEDQSGNGYHAVRAEPVTSGNFTWNTTVTDRGAGVLNFHGDNGAYLSIPNAVGTALSSAGHGQMWVRIKKVAGQKCDGSGFADFGTDSNANHYFWTDCNWYDGWGSNSRKNCGNVSFDTTSAFNVASVWSAPSDYGAMIDNGTHFSFTTVSNTVSFRTSSLRYGCSNATYGQNSYVSEIVIANAKASTAQNTAMQLYLSS